jgi:hypothetical protein
MLVAMMCKTVPLFPLNKSFAYTLEGLRTTVLTKRLASTMGQNSGLRISLRDLSHRRRV